MFFQWFEIAKTSKSKKNVGLKKRHFQRLLAHLDFWLYGEKLNMLFDRFDHNRDGVITISEFITRYTIDLV